MVDAKRNLAAPDSPKAPESRNNDVPDHRPRGMLTVAVSFKAV